MICFKINPELTCEKVCNALKKILDGGDHQGDTFLVITIKKVEQTNDDLIPKLTYEGGVDNND
jgi:hypothetical protein